MPESGTRRCGLRHGQVWTAKQELEEIEVTGFRLAQITALQDKRSAKIIKESVTANDAGKLPDQNAGRNAGARHGRCR